MTGSLPLLSLLRLDVLVVRSRRIESTLAPDIEGTFFLGFSLFGRAELSMLRETYDLDSVTSAVRTRLDMGPKPRIVYMTSNSKMKPTTAAMTMPTMAPGERESWREPYVSGMTTKVVVAESRCRATRDGPSPWIVLVANPGALASSSIGSRKRSGRAGMFVSVCPFLDPLRMETLIGQVML